jgi:hypothetical protein
VFLCGNECTLCDCHELGMSYFCHLKFLHVAFTSDRLERIFTINSLQDVFYYKRFDCQKYESIHTGSPGLKP